MKSVFGYMCDRCYCESSATSSWIKMKITEKYWDKTRYYDLCPNCYEALEKLMENGKRDRYEECDQDE
jgi:hypothetical protein